MHNYIIKIDCTGNLRIDRWDAILEIRHPVIHSNRPFCARQQEYQEPFASDAEAVAKGRRLAHEYAQIPG